MQEKQHEVLRKLAKSTNTKFDIAEGVVEQGSMSPGGVVRFGTVMNFESLDESLRGKTTRKASKTEKKSSLVMTERMGKIGLMVSRR